MEIHDWSVDDDVIIIEEYENLDEGPSSQGFGMDDGRGSHTRLGFACFFVGVAGGLLEFVLFLLFGSTTGDSPLNLRGINSGEIRPILIVGGALLFHSAGVVIGILSLVKRERSRAIPILGLLANLGMMAGVVVMVAVAWLVK